MNLQEEITRVRELMTLKEDTNQKDILSEASPPRFSSKYAKEFAEFLLQTVGKSTRSETLENLQKSLMRQSNEAADFLRKIKAQNFSDDAIEQFIKNLPEEDLYKIFKELDLAGLGMMEFNRTWKKSFTDAIQKNIGGLAGMSKREAQKEYNKLMNYWKKEIVGKGMGRFPSGPPQELLPYYETMYQTMRTSAEREFKKIYPDVKIKGRSAWAQQMNSRAMEDLTPLTSEQIARLARRNANFVGNMYQFMDIVTDYFRSKMSLMEEMSQIIKTLEGTTTNPQALKDRLEHIMVRMQKKDVEFAETYKRWVNTNVVGNPNLKEELLSLRGYERARALAPNGDVIKQINEDIGTFWQRRAKLNEQIRDVIFKWGKKWREKYGQSFWATVWKKGELKELKSWFFTGSKISPRDLVRIGRELGIPRAIMMGGKDIAMSYFLWHFYWALAETLWEGLSYTAYVNDWWLKDFWYDQIYDEEGNLEYTPVTSDDESYSFGMTAWNNFIEGLDPTEGWDDFINDPDLENLTKAAMPGYGDNIYRGFLRLWGELLTGFAGSKEAVKDFSDNSNFNDTINNFKDDVGVLRDSLLNHMPEGVDSVPPIAPQDDIPEDLLALLPEEVHSHLEKQTRNESNIKRGDYRFTSLSRNTTIVLSKDVNGDWCAVGDDGITYPLKSPGVMESLLNFWENN